MAEIRHAVTYSPFGEMMIQRNLRFPAVLEKTGFKSRSTIYEMIRRGEFVRPVKIGSRAVAFPEREVEDWIQARIAERDSQPFAA